MYSAFCFVFENVIFRIFPISIPAYLASTTLFALDIHFRHWTQMWNRVGHAPV